MDKPKCKLMGENGNIFNLIGIAAKTLRRKGYHDQIDEMVDRIGTCKSYHEAIAVLMDYVDVE